MAGSYFKSSFKLKPQPFSLNYQITPNPNPFLYKQILTPVAVHMIALAANITEK